MEQRSMFWLSSRNKVALTLLTLTLAISVRSIEKETSFDLKLKSSADSNLFNYQLLKFADILKSNISDDDAKCEIPNGAKFAEDYLFGDEDKAEEEEPEDDDEKRLTDSEYYIFSFNETSDLNDEDHDEDDKYLLGKSYDDLPLFDLNDLDDSLGDSGVSKNEDEDEDEEDDDEDFSDSWELDDSGDLGNSGDDDDEDEDEDELEDENEEDETGDSDENGDEDEDNENDTDDSNDEGEDDKVDADSGKEVIDSDEKFVYPNETVVLDVNNVTNVEVDDKTQDDSGNDNDTETRMLSSRRHSKRRKHHHKRRNHHKRHRKHHHKHHRKDRKHHKKEAKLRKFIRKINSMQSKWEAKMNHLLKLPEKVQRRMMACSHTNRKEHQKLPILHHILSKSESIPKKFDPRKKWPECRKVFNMIRNQENCGCCWSEATAGAVSDRICIKSKGEQKIPISAIDLQCCRHCMGESDQYCAGGYPHRAWKFYQSTGLVSGGDFEPVGCKPFTMKLARKHCVRKCTNHRYKEHSYKEDKRFAETVYRVAGNVKQIQAEVMKHGSVGIGMAVYSDFMAYKRGVYVPMSKRLVGYHAVRLVGWGTEKGEPYWLVANSWGKRWGIHGFFKITRRGDPCQIMDSVNTGKPKVKSISHAVCTNSCSVLLLLILIFNFLLIIL